MKRYELLRDILMLCVFCFLLLMIGFVLGVKSYENKVQQEAVRLGVAVWATDKDGNSTFQWKEISK